MKSTGVMTPVHNPVPGAAPLHIQPALQDPGMEARPGESGRAPFMKRLIASGALRFAGWWSIFAGALALNSVCPICGGAACPVGIGATGVIAGILAGTKQWGGRLVAMIVRRIKPSAFSKNSDAKPTCSCQCSHEQDACPENETTGDTHNDQSP